MLTDSGAAWIGSSMADRIVAGTGSRSLQDADNATKRAAMGLVTRCLHARLSEHPGLIVMSGMAEGFDKALALTAIDLGIRLWAAVPNSGYAAYYWGRNSLTGTDQSRLFADIVRRAWRVTYVMEDIYEASGLYLDGQHSNFVRNDFMVDTADEFLVWDPSSKGTADCLVSIRRARKPYEVLSPEPAALLG